MTLGYHQLSSKENMVQVHYQSCKLLLLYSLSCAELYDYQETFFEIAQVNHLRLWMKSFHWLSLEPTVSLLLKPDLEVKTESLSLDSGFLSTIWSWSVCSVFFIKKSLTDICLIPICDVSEHCISVLFCSDELDSDGSTVSFSLCSMESFLAKTNLTEAFSSWHFIHACYIKAKHPLFATWTSLSNNLQMALNLFVSCSWHHHSSICQFPPLFFSQSTLNFVSECAILKCYWLSLSKPEKLF